MAQQTIKEAARDAIRVQDACNLSGVAESFLQAIHAVRAEAQRLGHGTDWINRHPICILFASKIESLTGSDFGSAFLLCRDIEAASPKPPKMSCEGGSDESPETTP